jgi:cobyrinic acid a,c-diamide synthase
VLKLLGVNPVGVILNKMSTSYLDEEDMQTIKLALENAGVALVGIVPSMKLEKRGMIPEVEICYKDFGSQAIDVVERYLDLDKLVKLAKAPKQIDVDYAAFVEKFKNLLIKYSDKIS